MIPAEVPQLIAKIALADPRLRRDSTPERVAQVDLWVQALADVPADYAYRAVGAHYRVSQWPITPADIATRWAQDAKDRLGRHTDPIPAADPDDDSRWRAELAATRRAVATGQVEPAPHALAAGRPIAAAELTAGIGRTIPTRNQAEPYLPEAIRTALAQAGVRGGPPERSVPCPVPTCLARPNARCTSPSGRRLADSHPSRVDRYLVQTAA